MPTNLVQGGIVHSSIHVRWNGGKHTAYKALALPQFSSNCQPEGSRNQCFHHYQVYVAIQRKIWPALAMHCALETIASLTSKLELCCGEWQPTMHKYIQTSLVPSPTPSFSLLAVRKSLGTRLSTNHEHVLFHR